jgi:hypothetical protein
VAGGTGCDWAVAGGTEAAAGPGAAPIAAPLEAADDPGMFAVLAADAAGAVAGEAGAL